MIETNHPLFLSADGGDLEPCNRGDMCKLWGTGDLRIELDEQKGEYRALTLFTFAGCMACRNPLVTSENNRVVNGHGGFVEISHDELVDREAEASTEIIAEIINNLPKETAPRIHLA